MLLFSLDFYTPANGNKYTNTDHALTQATTTAASNQSLIHIILSPFTSSCTFIGLKMR